MSARFPVITGLGIVAAPGCGVDEVWRSIAANASGLKPLTLFPSPRYGQVLTGEVQRSLSSLGAPLRGSRSDRLAWLAARDAIRSAAIDLESKLTEAALMPVQVADFRNFAHGRHHWLAKRGGETAVLALVCESDAEVADGATEKA